MRRNIKNFVCMLLAMLSVEALSQQNMPADSAAAEVQHQREPFGWKATIIPAAAAAYGFATLGSTPLKNLDQQARREFYLEHPHRRILVDDYLQFAPGVVSIGLSASGVKGRNGTADQTGIYIISNLLLNSFTQGVKYATDVTRPDGTSHSFPSGHTAEAFASAELMRREYGGRSVWYIISSYTVASSVGIFRMYNNKHWFSDIVAGAGVGVLSTQAAYWLYPKIKRLLFAKKDSAILLPSYGQAGFSATFSKSF